MRFNKYIYPSIFVLLLALTSAACTPETNSFDPDEFADNSTSISGGDNYFPNDSGSTDTCETNEDGDCAETDSNSNPVFLSTNSIDFGLGEKNEQECHAISLPGGQTYSAEIDKSNTDDVAGNYQFALQDSSGDASQERVEGSDEVTICYLREDTGSHKGQIKLILNSGNSSSAAYAYMIATSGETLESLFTITAPTEGQIIDELHNEGIDNAEGDYLITASGSMNMDLTSILESGTNTDIIIDADGVKYKASFDDSGNFSKQIGLSQTQGVYNVTFSADTTKGSSLSKTVSVVVAGTPKLEIEVRDSNGEKVDATDPTDAPNLIIGLKITNLDSSGSSQSDMPVTLSDIQFNGTKLADDDEIYYDGSTSWCFDEDDEDYAGFVTTLTYCIPLEDITVVQSGINTITASATNYLGTVTDQYELILDYDKPSITISKPKQNELKTPGLSTITIAGTVKNFEPLTVDSDGSDYDNVPQVQSGDTGSFCQPQSTDDTTCPVSSIKLWFNLSPDDDNPPIYIYPEYSSDYDLANTFTNNNQSIFDEETTRGSCHTTESTTVIFDGDSDNTTIDENGNIVTTITDEEEGTTTTYTTDENGNVTVTEGDSTVDEVIIEDEDNVSTAISIDSDSNDITSTVTDNNTDIVITTTTDATSGEITQTTEQRICNIPEGSFSFTLNLPSDDHHAKLNLYTNILEFQANSISGHRTIKVVSFQTGYTSGHKRESVNTTSGTLTAGQLGKIKDDCGNNTAVCVDRAPVMLSLSEGILNKQSEQGKKVIKLLENLLNENFKFEEFSNGWTFWPRDDNDEIDLEADFQRQYKEENNGQGYDDFHDLPMSWKEPFIQQGLHSNVMAIKMWALARYVDVLQDNEDLDCDERPDLCFFERHGNPVTEYNVARDACDEIITTAFVPIGDIRHVAKHWDVDLNEIHLKLPEWTDVAGDDIEFNDFHSGKWIVHSIDLKDNGYLDADICLVPDDEDNPDLEAQYEFFGCDADVSMAQTPAFWGHFVSYNLVYGGLLGPMADVTLPGGATLQVDDATMPLIWSVGKLRLKLTDVLQLSVSQEGNPWTNKLNINEDNIEIIESDDDLLDLLDPEIMGSKSIQIEAFSNCEAYYEELFPGYDTPFGCHSDSSRNYPFVLEVNSAQGQRIYNGPMMEGRSAYLLGAVWQGVIWTFRKQIGCMDTELVNPILSDAFDYPSWVWEGNTFSTDFEWEFMNFGTNLKNSDLQLDNGGIVVRVPLSLGVDGVSLLSRLDRDLSTFMRFNRANTRGHLIRSKDELDSIFYNGLLSQAPLESTNPQDEAFTGISLNVEELFNAATYLLFKKGPLELVDLLDITELEPTDNWTIGIDKVVLGRFDICDLAGLIPADLPKDMLFASVQSLFDEPALHLEVMLNKNHPPTLSFNEIDGVDNATEIQLGLTNVQISVKELKSYETSTGETLNNEYINPKDQEEILRVRVDGVLSLKAIYHKTSRQFNIFIEGYENQNIHLSVPAGHGGGSYDDINIVTDLITTVIQPVFSMMKKEFSSDETATATISISLSGISGDEETGSISVSKLNNAQMDVNIDSAPNASCDGDVPVYHETSGGFSNIVVAQQIVLPQNIQDLLDRLQNISSSDDSEEDEDEDEDDTGNGPNEITPENVDLDNIFNRSDCDQFITIEDNPIQEALCNLGINDIIITPDLIFDNNNGYIHISADLAIELEKWLEEE